jgi:hypothetical protein
MKSAKADFIQCPCGACPHKRSTKDALIPFLTYRGSGRTFLIFFLEFTALFPLRYPTFQVSFDYGLDRMIVTTKNGESFDTESDLTAPERHILQKLFLWKSMACSLEEFRSKKEEALRKGWNHSGPVLESRALKAIVKELEENVVQRLREEKKS